MKKRVKALLFNVYGVYTAVTEPKGKCPLYDPCAWLLSIWVPHPATTVDLM